MKSNYLVIGLLFSLISFGQNIRQEIVSINKALLKETTIAMEIIRKVYEDEKKSPIHEEKVTVYKTKEKYLYVSGPTESLTNNSYQLNINHAKKLITISKAIKRTSVGKQPDLNAFDKDSYSSRLDTMLTLYKKVSIRSLDEKYNQITFVFKDGAYDFITVTYTKKDYRVYSTFIKSRPTERDPHVYSCNIDYKHLSTQNLNNDFFSEAKYINVKNKRVIPISKYTGYKIMNYTNKKG